MSFVADRRVGLRRAASLALALVALTLAGCSAAVRLAVRPYYRPVRLEDGTVKVLRDLPYRDDTEADAEKHRLDLYRPLEPGWPVLVFVHGGALIDGDKDLEVGGFDVYGNVGRFYAARGIGVALVNYRLQPEVRWPQQADDVAAALSWIVRRAREYGGDGRIFLSGHSAGAWLVARLALDQERLGRFGLTPDELSGVIAVSGSGYDMRDSRTWEMFGREDWWAERFDPGVPGLDWHEAASVVPLLEDNGARPFVGPPYLLIHSSREWRALARQNRLFYEALQQAGIPSELVTVATDTHRRMVLAMSRADKEVAAKILEFVNGARGNHPGAP